MNRWRNASDVSQSIYLPYDLYMRISTYLSAIGYYSIYKDASYSIYLDPNLDFYIKLSIAGSAFGWFFLYIDASYSMNLCLYRSLSPPLSLFEFLYHCRHSDIFLMNMNMPCSIIHIFLHLPMPISHDQDRQLDDPVHI